MSSIRSNSVAYQAARRAVTASENRDRDAQLGHTLSQQDNADPSIVTTNSEKAKRLEKGSSREKLRDVESRIIDWLEMEVKIRLMRIDAKLEQLTSQAATSQAVANGHTNGSPVWHERHVVPQAFPPVACEFPANSTLPNSDGRGPSEQKPGRDIVVQPALPQELALAQREETDAITNSVATSGSKDFETSMNSALFALSLPENVESEHRQSAVAFDSEVGAQGNTTESSGPPKPRRRSSSRQKMPRLSAISATSEEIGAHHILRNKSRQSKHAEHVFAFLSDSESSQAAWWYAHLMPWVIVLAALFPLLQTIENTPIKGVVVAGVDTAIDILFLMEVVLRFITCPNKCRFFLGAYNIVDILAALPPLILRITIDFVITEQTRERTIETILLCIVPIFRLMKTLRRFQKFLLLLSAFGLAFEALPVLLFTLGMIALVFSSLIFIVEPRDNIQSWPEALWLTIVTMTTVGYGDMVPSTAAGYIITSALVVSSVLYMAMPLGIIGSAFTRIWRDRDKILLMQRTHDLLVQWGYTAEDIPELFHLFDADGSSELNLQEFTRMIAHMRLGLKNERVIELFESFDQDGSGSIDDEEFVRALFPNQYQELYGADSAKETKRSYSSWRSSISQQDQMEVTASRSLRNKSKNSGQMGEIT